MLHQNIYIKVPLGTIVKDAESGKVIVDMSKPGQKELILKGGRGGKGNSHFATSTRQAPRFAQDGEKGLEKEVILELKLFILKNPFSLCSKLSIFCISILQFPFSSYKGKMLKH